MPSACRCNTHSISVLPGYPTPLTHRSTGIIFISIKPACFVEIIHHAVNSFSKTRHQSNSSNRRFLIPFETLCRAHHRPLKQHRAYLPSSMIYRIKLTLTNIHWDAVLGRTPAYQAPSNLSDSYRTRCRTSITNTALLISSQTPSKAKRAVTHVSHRLLGCFKQGFHLQDVPNQMRLSTRISIRHIMRKSEP